MSGKAPAPAKGGTQGRPGVTPGPGFMAGLWQAMGHIHLTLVIIALMVADLTFGYFMLKAHNHLFHAINDMGFIPWAGTWGKESLVAASWLFILVGLLALLAVNTFVCTTDRVMALWQRRRHFASRFRFLVRLGPHIMHYSLLVMLLGYLFSYIFAQTFLGRVLIPGRSIRIQTVEIHLDRLDIGYYQDGQRPGPAGKASAVKAFLRFKDQDGQTADTWISFSRPARFRGLSVHLSDFSPKTQSNGMGRRQFISLIVKSDPGTGFYFAGMALFVAGLFLYVWDKLALDVKLARTYQINKQGTS